MRRLGAALLLVLAWLGPAGAAPPVADLFKAGLDAYQRGEFEAALGAWTEAAINGHADSQYLVGTMYLNGEGMTAPEPDAAVFYYQLAVEQDHVEALVGLGTLYRLGHGVARDMHKAAELLYEAAIAGHAQAQVDLGDMFSTGEDDLVTHDPTHALSWYILAGKQQVAIAQLKVAQMFLEGLGTQRDFIEGMAWSNAAVALAVAPAEPRWSKRIFPLDRVVETDKDKRTLRQLILDIHDRYAEQLSPLQLQKAAARAHSLDLAPLE